MRLVQVAVPTGKREAVLTALDDEGIDYVVAEETSGREFDAIVSFPLPTNAVEPILDRLRDAGVERDAYTVVVDAETVVSRKFEHLQEEYEEEKSEDRIAREELQTAAKDLAPSNQTFFLMTIISAVIATAGLLLDSPAVVVGSMVIAPLIGPAMAASVGTVIADDDLFSRGVKLQLLGMSVAVVAAAVFAFLLKTFAIVPPGLDLLSVEEIRGRVTPDVLSLAVALGAGVAGAVSLTTGVSAAIVGVMIAVALMPPAATVGIAIAWGHPMMALSSGILALVNGLSINLAALAVLWYAGYRPEHWFHLEEARTATLKRIGVLVVAIALLSIFLGAVTLTTVQTARFHEQVNDEVSQTLESGQYESLGLIETRVTGGEGVVFGRPDRVVVTVGRPTDSRYPDLATRLRERIRAATGRSVAVQVRFVDVETARGATGASARRTARVTGRTHRDAPVPRGVGASLSA